MAQVGVGEFNSAERFQIDENPKDAMLTISNGILWIIVPNSIGLPDCDIRFAGYRHPHVVQRDWSEMHATTRQIMS